MGFDNRWLLARLKHRGPVHEGEACQRIDMTGSSRGWVGLTGLVCLLISAGWCASKPASAARLRQQPRVVWGEPQVAWQTLGTISAPQVITDAAERPHLFFLEQVGDASTLYHAFVSGGPITPVDVQVGSFSEFRSVADRSGMIHVLFHGSGNRLLLTSAPAGQAGVASAWSPIAHIEDATTGSDLSADRRGVLHLCFPSGQELRYSQSEDGGLHWSESVVIAQMRAADGIAVEARCVADTEGIVHAVWSEVTPPNFYPSDGVFYSQSPDGGVSWDTSTDIAGQRYTLPSLLTDANGLLHLIWQGDVSVGGRYYRQRSAGQQGTWSDTETIIPGRQGGMSGIAGMALDSLDRLHTVIAVTNGAVWAGRGPTWLAPVLLTGSLDDLPNESGSIGEGPTLAISQGNELTAAFNFDLKRLYVIQGQSDSPPVTAVPIATPQSTEISADVTATALAAVSALVTARQARTTPTPSLDMTSLTEGRGASLPAVQLGMVGALLLIGLTLLRGWRKRR